MLGDPQPHTRLPMGLSCAHLRTANTIASDHREHGVTRRASGVRRKLVTLLAIPAAAVAALGIARPMTTLAATASSSVGYLTDASSSGFTLWGDGINVTPVADGGTYSTASPATALTVTIHNIDMTRLDVPGSTALTGMDTVVMYEVCDIGSHPNAVTALNTFFNNGGKLIVLDGGLCVDGTGGQADYRGFAKPFTPDYLLPIPQYTAGKYTSINSTSLTTGLPDCTPYPGCNEPGNAVGDATVLSPNSDGWCKSIGGTSTNGIAGPLEAYARSGSGSGLIVYSGEPFAYSAGLATQWKHNRLLLDNTLTQGWNPDPLGCQTPQKSLTLTPAADSPFTGVNETVTAHVTDGQGHPAAGILVTFKVVSGPNLNTSGTGTTDGTGTASFTYTSSKAGIDVVRASFTDPDHHLSGPANITWAAAPPPVIAETHTAILVPAIGFLVVVGGLFLTMVRRRRRIAPQTR